MKGEHFHHKNLFVPGLTESSRSFPRSSRNGKTHLAVPLHAFDFLWSVDQSWLFALWFSSVSGNSSEAQGHSCYVGCSNYFFLKEKYHPDCPKWKGDQLCQLVQVNFFFLMLQRDKLCHMCRRDEARWAGIQYVVGLAGRQGHFPSCSQGSSPPYLCCATSRKASPLF